MATIMPTHIDAAQQPFPEMAPFRPASTPTGSTIGPGNVLPTALDVTAAPGPDGALPCA
jgi:hypothetical protein